MRRQHANSTAGAPNGKFGLNNKKVFYANFHDVFLRIVACIFEKLE